MDGVYEDTLKAVNRMYGDTSVSKDTTIQRLESLKDEINCMIESLCV